MRARHSGGWRCGKARSEWRSEKLRTAAEPIRTLNGALTRFPARRYPTGAAQAMTRACLRAKKYEWSWLAKFPADSGLPSPCGGHVPRKNALARWPRCPCWAAQPARSKTTHNPPSLWAPQALAAQNPDEEDHPVRVWGQTATTKRPPNHPAAVLWPKSVPFWRR